MQAHCIQEGVVAAGHCRPGQNKAKDKEQERNVESYRSDRAISQAHFSNRTRHGHAVIRYPWASSPRSSSSMRVPGRPGALESGICSQSVRDSTLTLRIWVRGDFFVCGGFIGYRGCLVAPCRRSGKCTWFYLPAWFACCAPLPPVLPCCAVFCFALLNWTW